MHHSCGGSGELPDLLFSCADGLTRASMIVALISSLLFLSAALRSNSLLSVDCTAFSYRSIPHPDRTHLFAPHISSTCMRTSASALGSYPMMK